MLKKQFVRGAVTALVLGLPLAACSGGGGGRSERPSQPPTVVAPAPTQQEDRFGLAFGSYFRASANSEPSPVNDGDIVAVSFTTEPIDLTP